MYKPQSLGKVRELPQGVVPNPLLRRHRRARATYPHFPTQPLSHVLPRLVAAAAAAEAQEPTVGVQQQPAPPTPAQAGINNSSQTAEPALAGVRVRRIPPAGTYGHQPPTL